MSPLCQWCGRSVDAWATVRIECGPEAVFGLCPECISFAVANIRERWESIKKERRTIGAVEGKP